MNSINKRVLIHTVSTKPHDFKVAHTFTAIVTLLLSFSALLFAGSGSYWQQWVHYRMEVSLNPVEHLLSGESTITYVNNSPDTLDRIYMHLYPNAFQEGSVKDREFQLLGWGAMSKDNPSYIDIKQFEIVSSDGSVSSQFKVEDTILFAPLQASLFPGDSMIITLRWDHKVREHLGRAGYIGEQYDFAQWYPKMVVYDDRGWHAEPFHAVGDFYGEFATFDVSVNIPAPYIVGATGLVVLGDPGWESVAVDTSLPFSEWLEAVESNAASIDSLARRVVTFHAENVHDFAWITSPTFVYEHGKWDGIDVHVLYNTTVGEKWTRVARERSERALEWLSTNFGPYPYPQVTVTHGVLVSGMEYPMLVMMGKVLEGFVVHEIGHMWFYGALANNEADEEWMDEGFTTFQTRWYLENRYPPSGIDFESSTWGHLWALEHGLGDFEKRRWSFNSYSELDQWKAISFITSPYNEPIASKLYPFFNASIKASLMCNPFAMFSAQTRSTGQ